MENNTFEKSQEFSVSIGVRTPIIFIVSFLIIVSNVLNIVILSTRIKNIPLIAKICLLNLSIVDLCTGIVVCGPCIVPAILGYWPFGDIWCQIAGLTHGTCVTMSMWSLAIISLDRYTALVKPLRYPALVTVKRCYITLAVTWVVAIGTFASVIFAEPDFIYYQFNFNEGVCGLYFENNLFCIITSLPIPFLTGSVIIFSTVSITKELSKTNYGKTRHGKPIKIIVRSALAFFLFWGPYCVSTLITAFNPLIHPPREAQFVFMWMGNSNSFVNVFIYSAVYKSFRQQAKFFLKPVLCFCCKNPDVPSMTSSVSQVPLHGSEMPTY